MDTIVHDIHISSFIPYNQKENYQKLVQLGADLSCKSKLETSKKGDTLKHIFKLKNRNLFSVKLNTATLEVKPALWHIEYFSDVVENAQSTIKSPIFNARECKDCTDRCGGGVNFVLSGQKQYKCLFSGFQYLNPTDDEIDTLLNLISLEKTAREQV